jgi:hypothetical protein
VFTELVDRLRCPRPHAESWLVAASDATQGRRIVRGTLGCPVCDAEYPIVAGVAHFAGADATPATATHPLHAAQLDDGAASLDDAVDRLAAQLHLVEAPEPILLVGTWGALALPLLRHYPHAVALVADAPATLPLDERLSPLVLPAARLPLADGSVRAIAVDAAHAGDAWLAEAARVATAGARLVTPVTHAPPPGDWTLVAADAHVHVAVRAARASAPVQLRRAPTNFLFDPPR